MTLKHHGIKRIQADGKTINHPFRWYISDKNEGKNIDTGIRICHGEVYR